MLRCITSIRLKQEGYFLLCFSYIPYGVGGAGFWTGSLGFWVLHLTVPLWILPLRYFQYAGVAKARFHPSTLLLFLSPSISLFFCCSVGDGHLEDQCSGLVDATEGRANVPFRDGMEMLEETSFQPVPSLKSSDPSKEGEGRLSPTKEETWGG